MKLAIGILLASVSVWAQSSGATVSGTLQDESGKPISKALVVLTIQPAPPPAVTKPYYAATESAADGTYMIGNVPEGEFRLCAQAPGTRFLNPCEWGGGVAGGLGGPVSGAVEGPSPGAPVLAVKGTTSVNAGITELVEGYLLRVEVSDTQNVVKDNVRKLGDAHLGFEVRGLGRTLLLRPIPGGRTENEYGVVVPFDVDLDLVTHFNKFEVADEEGLSAVAEKQLTRRMRFAKADAAKSVKIRVSGVKAQ